MTKKKIGIIAGIAAAVLILACVAVWFFFFREAAMPSDPNEIAYVNTVSDITQEGGLGMTTKFSGVAEPEDALRPEGRHEKNRRAARGRRAGSQDRRSAFQL